jgi:endoglucanase
VGWPDAVHGDADRWNALGEAWYRDADAADLWVTAWATGEWWGADYRLNPYEDRSPPPGVETPNTQAPVIERHGGTFRGINVAGAEFGAPGPLDRVTRFSNRSPGKVENAYHYDTAATFRFLRARGVRLVRLAFRWERLQPRLGRRFDRREARRLLRAARRARSAGLTVIIDPHNFGAYWLARGSRGVRRPIGSRQVPIRRFADLWRRLSRMFKRRRGVVYGLMTEPVAMPGRRPARTWERASRAALRAIRKRGDRHVVLVPGYDYSAAQSWSKTHPRPWVHDSANRIRYDAHHYFDRDNSGRYERPYAAELEDARRRGF